MPLQVPHPSRRRQPALLVRLDEQCGDCTPELHCLLGREIHGQLIQQADELAHVGRPRNLTLCGEPAFQVPPYDRLGTVGQELDELPIVAGDGRIKERVDRLLNAKN